MHLNNFLSILMKFNFLLLIIPKWNLRPLSICDASLWKFRANCLSLKSWIIIPIKWNVFLSFLFNLIRIFWDLEMWLISLISHRRFFRLLFCFCLLRHFLLCCITINIPLLNLFNFNPIIFLNSKYFFSVYIHGVFFVYLFSCYNTLF